MRYYTINYFNEKTETYCGGDLECAMAYAQMRLDSICYTMSKGHNIEITDAHGLVAKLPYERKFDTIGEYFEQLNWIVLRK